MAPLSDPCTFQAPSRARVGGVQGGLVLRVRLAGRISSTLLLSLGLASSGCAASSHDDASEARERARQSVASVAAEDAEDGLPPAPSTLAVTETDDSCRRRSHALSACRNDRGSVCVDLQRDPENCGACGRRCRGGTCAEGHCESCSVEVGPDESWECREGSACRELHCPGMDTRPGRPLLVHFSGTVDGVPASAVTLSLVDASERPSGTATRTCGSPSRSSSIECVLPSPEPGQSSLLVVPPDGTVRVRLSGACGRAGTCRIESGSVLRIFRP